jgi:phosphoglycerol geranylgeranyltransferase
MSQSHYQSLLNKCSKDARSLAILIDPDKFNHKNSEIFFEELPVDATHIFVGGSSVEKDEVERTVETVKRKTSLPLFIFPGDHDQLNSMADAVLFLSLLSGRNAEYLIGQQVKAVAEIRKTKVETIPTAYLLIDGGNKSAVAHVTGTNPMKQDEIELIVDTAKAGELMGAKLVYLEAGSGALNPVSSDIISAVKGDIGIPLIVGGGIKSETQKEAAYQAGADMVVMGTIFEEKMNKTNPLF